MSDEAIKGFVLGMGTVFLWPIYMILNSKIISLANFMNICGWKYAGRGVWELSVASNDEANK